MNAPSPISELSERNALFGADVIRKVMFVWYAFLPSTSTYSICARIKLCHVQDEAENRYFTVRILGQERFRERRNREEKRAFRVRVKERVNAGKYQSRWSCLTRSEGNFPGSQRDPVLVLFLIWWSFSLSFLTCLANVKHDHAIFPRF